MDDSVLGLSSRNGGQAVSDFCYVYILDSLSHPGCHYTGLTDNLQARLAKHNEGGCIHTAKHKPWQIRIAVAFRNREQAAAFESYLKSHSGRAFAARHF